MYKFLNEITLNMELKGIANPNYYENGIIKDCVLNEENIIGTKYGNLIPKYGPDEARRKFIPSISFYRSGAVRSISLEQQTEIPTPLGTFPAELVTFYESGAIKRLFPLNGKISGYWTEADEEKLCREFQFNFPFGSFKTRIISLYFYEGGNLKAMTLWPGETVVLRKQVDLFPVRIGFSLYEDGCLKSVEPAYELPISTPIGNITAYDESAVGISGESNSLSFKKDGSLHSVVTSGSKVAVSDKNGATAIMQPGLMPDPLEEDRLIVVPLKIIFDGSYVKFEGERTAVYDLSTFRFSVINETYTGALT
jgi:hypothetical protein